MEQSIQDLESTDPRKEHYDEEVHRWYPREYSKYIKTTHYEESLLYRDIDEKYVEQVLEDGEIFSGEGDTLGFQKEFDGITIVIIVSPKTVKKPSTLVTTWQYVSDFDTAIDENSMWDERYVKLVDIQTRRHLDTKEKIRRVQNDG